MTLNEAFTRHYKDIKDIIDKYWPVTCNYKSDLLHDIYLQLHQLPQDKLNHLIDNKQLTLYIVGMVARSINPKHEFHKHYSIESNNKLQFTDIEQLSLVDTDELDVSSNTFNHKQFEQAQFIKPLIDIMPNIINKLNKSFTIEEIVELVEWLKSVNRLDKKSLLYLMFIVKYSKDYKKWMKYKSKLDIYNKFKFKLSLTQSVIMQDYLKNNETMRSIAPKYNINYTRVCHILTDGWRRIFNG
jgi:hypothetical protein